MIDAHCHLNFHSFKDDVEDIVKKAREDGVTTIVNVGTKLDSSQHAVDLANKFDVCLAIVGVHPHHADKVERGWEKELEKIAKQEKVIGIGECGLDYFSYKSNAIVDPKTQKTVFEAQIELAHKLDLPLQIHNRQAGEDVIEILKHHKNILKNPPGMFHCFAGTKEVLRNALDLGFYIGFDGNITYKGLAPGETVALSEIIKVTTLDRILVETDSPYLTPEPMRGARNTPSNVIIVGRYIAEVRGISYEVFEDIVEASFKKVFFYRK